MRLLSLFILLLFYTTGFSQKIDQIPKAPEFPPTPLGVLAKEWFAVVERGSQENISKFVQANFSAEGRKGNAVGDSVATMMKLHQQSGGLEVLSITPPVGVFGMTMICKSRIGDHYARIAIGEDAKEPGKIIGFGIWKIERPGAESQIKWPARKLTQGEMIREIGRQVARRANEGKFSGVVLIAKGDEILLHTAYGMAARSFMVPNNLHTKFNIASVGKMFTATAIAQLVENGKISYEDKLIKHLPDFPNKDAAAKITVHQLLTHTAGLGTLFTSPNYDRYKRYRSSWDQVSAFADEALFFEPGTKWRYSNAGYVTLGAIIERVTGTKYVDYVREKVLRPLGMTATDSYANDEVVPNLSVLYIQSPEDVLGIEPYVADHTLAGYRGNAEGGGYSTALDLFKFARSYRNNKLLGAAAQQMLTDVKVDEDGTGKNFWGYGVRQVLVNGQSVRGHSGGGRTHLQMVWDTDYTVIVQTNVVPPSVTVLSNQIVDFITKQVSMKK